MYVRLLLLAATAVTTTSGLNVLFVGNSYTSVNDLPAVFKTVTESMLADVTVTTTQSLPGGFRLTDHASNAATREAVNKGGYDVMVLQEQSQVAGLWWYGNEMELEMEALDELFVPGANKTGASIVFYETWGRKAGDPNKAFYNFYSYNAMQCSLSNGYAEMAWHVRGSWPSSGVPCVQKVSVAPVGTAFQEVYFRSGGTYLAGEVPGDETLFARLYASDGSHPTMLGTYLAALTLFGTIFENRRAEWAATLPVVPAGVSAQDAEVLLQVARKVTAPLPADLLALQGLYRTWPQASGEYIIRGWNAAFLDTCVNTPITRGSGGELRIGFEQERVLREEGGIVMTVSRLNGSTDMFCVDRFRAAMCLEGAAATCPAATPTPTQAPPTAVLAPCAYNTHTECVADLHCAISSEGACMVMSPSAAVVTSAPKTRAPHTSAPETQTPLGLNLTKIPASVTPSAAVVTSAPKTYASRSPPPETQTPFGLNLTKIPASVTPNAAVTSVTSAPTDVSPRPTAVPAVGAPTLPPNSIPQEVAATAASTAPVTVTQMPSSSRTEMQTPTDVPPVVASGQSEEEGKTSYTMLLWLLLPAAVLGGVAFAAIGLLYERWTATRGVRLSEIMDLMPKDEEGELQYTHI